MRALTSSEDVSGKEVRDGGGKSGGIWGEAEKEGAMEARSLEILELKAERKAAGRSGGKMEEGKTEDRVRPRRRLRDFQSRRGLPEWVEIWFWKKTRRVEETNLARTLACNLKFRRSGRERERR